MSDLFRDIPEAIANTHIVSGRLRVHTEQSRIRVSTLPCGRSQTMDSFLAKRVDEGVRNRYVRTLKQKLLVRARASTT